MAQQIYRKEKIRGKKARIDFSNSNLEYIKEKIKRLNAGYNHRKNVFKTIEDYFELCNEFNININIKTMSTLDIDNTFDVIKKKEADKVLKKKKNDKKEDLFQMICSKKIGHFNIVLTSKRRKFEDCLKNETIWREVLAPFEKNKNRFVKSLTEKETKFLFTIVSNSDKWVRKPNDFSFTSKNNNKLISNYASFVLWEYSTNEIEKALLLEQEYFDIFYETKSFLKTVKKISSEFPLTKKQIARFKDYSSSFEWENIKDIKKEFFIFDIIRDINITKSLMSESYNDIFVKYCHYVKNRILPEPFFDRNQIKPIFDFVKEKVRLTAESERLARIEAQDNNIKFYYHLEHHNVFDLYDGMQAWHKTLHKRKASELKIWDKSTKIKEYIEEKFKNQEDSIDKYKYSNYKVESIIELNSSALLSDEGRNMKHCVGSYARSCVYGNTRIFSLRKKDYSNHFVKSYATIQVDNEERIVQALSFKNDPLSITDKNIISK